MIAAAVLAAAALGTAAACGDDEPSTAGPAATTTPRGSGYFVGRSSDGVGAAVDMGAHDGYTERAAEALLSATTPDDPPLVTVGVASVVNNSARPVPVPRFIAVMEDGGAVPLTGARDPASGIPGARRIFPAPPLFVPAGGAVTLHVALRGVRPGDVRRMKMVVRAGAPVTLSAHRR